MVQKYLEDNGVAPKEMSKEEIIDAMLALGINEAALMMEEGICDRPQDMDLAMIYGTGFPPYRGGILRYADKWGLKNVYEKLVVWKSNTGCALNRPNLIKEMARIRSEHFIKNRILANSSRQSDSTNTHGGKNHERSRHRRIFKNCPIAVQTQ